MLSMEPASARRESRGDHGDITDLVLSIGTPGFAEEMLYLLERDIDLASCAVLVFRDKGFVPLVSASTAPIGRGHVRPVTVDTGLTLHIDPSVAYSAPPSSQGYRQILIRSAEDRGDIALGLEATRSFDRDGVAAVASRAKLLLTLSWKHADTLIRQERMAHAITDLDEIDHHIAAAPEQLSPREAQVCARILYGQTTTGIALELGIGNESVMTYRKRAYRRLQIASHRELLCWYLTLRARETLGSPRRQDAASTRLAS